MIVLIYIVPKKHSPNKEIAIKEKDVIVPAHRNGKQLFLSPLPFCFLINPDISV